jgi:hypothetical protein
MFQFFVFKASKAKVKRVQAVFDCAADNDDELSFSEGEIIVVSAEADPDWWVSDKRCSVVFQMQGNKCCHPYR